MEVKTKFNTKETVYFLTNSTDYLDDTDYRLKKGEVYVCKGEVCGIKIIGDYNGNYDVIYEIIVMAYGCSKKKVEIHENFCAPDTTQLGINVTNRYYLSDNNQKKIKRK